MEVSLIRLALITAPLIASAAAAQTPGFWLIGLAPQTGQGWVTSLTQDGGIAAGYCFGVPPQHPASAPGFLWTRSGGRVDFGLQPGMPLYTVTSGINSDGEVIVGHTEDGGQPARAFRRVGTGPLQNLGVLPGEAATRATGVSGDGMTVVGAATHGGGPGGAGGQAFRWTEATGLQSLGFLRPGSTLSEANGISRDGSTIVGTSRAFEYEGFRWTQAGGMQPLPTILGAPNIESFAHAVNADGSVVVGSATSATPQGYSHAVRWTPSGVEDLGTLLAATSHAYAVSDDGNVIGGVSGQRAFVWTPATGIRNLTDYLLVHGVTTPSDYRLEYVYAISGDGLTFGGEARNLITNVREGFVATIPSPSAAMVLLAPIFATRRRRT